MAEEMPEGAMRESMLMSVLQGEAMQPATQEEWLQFLAQVYYLVHDNETMQQLRDDADLRVLMPMTSPLLRTSYLDAGTIKIMKLRARRSLRLQLLARKTPNLVSVAKFDAWLNFICAAIEDTKEGWRGRLVTERIKVHKVEGAARRRKKFLGLF